MKLVRMDLYLDVVVSDLEASQDICVLVMHILLNFGSVLEGLRLRKELVF